MTSPLFVYIHQIFEPETRQGMDAPVAEHRFYGPSPEAVTKAFEAHKRTDFHLRDSADRGTWKHHKCFIQAWIQQVR